MAKVTRFTSDQVEILNDLVRYNPARRRWEAGIGDVGGPGGNVSRGFGTILNEMNLAADEAVSNQFYGVTVAQTDGASSFSNLNKVNFNSDNFYVTQNDPNTDEVIVNFKGGSDAEANTGSSLGGDADVFKQKTGVNLEFRGLSAAAGIKLTENANDIDIESTVEEFYGLIVEESNLTNTFKKERIVFTSSDFDIADDGTGDPQVSASSNIARSSDIPPGFYGITVAEPDEGNFFSNLKQLNFSPDFYLTQNSPNTDEVRIELRESHPHQEIVSPDGTDRVLVGNESTDFVRAGTRRLKLSGNNLTPENDATINLGSDDFRLDTVFGRFGQFVGGDGLRSPTGNPAGLLAGVVSGTGELILRGTTPPNILPAAVIGVASATSGNSATVEGTGEGSTTIGTAVSSSTGTAYIYNNAIGGFTSGYAKNTGAGTSKIENTGRGATVFGYSGAVGDNNLIAGGIASFVAGAANCLGANATCTIETTGTGSAVIGVALTLPASTGSATVEATGNSALAGGLARSTGSGAALIRASGQGSGLQGTAIATNSNATMQATGSGSHVFGGAVGVTSAGTLESTNSGAIAFGYARDGTITASGSGSLALGRTASTGTITASGLGSLAVGYSNNTAITASATNSVQFGPGANSTANSIQVGSDFLAKSNGQHAGANDALTLGAAATTFAATSNVMTITGDGGGNTIATITGGINGQLLTLIFVDGNVTITDDNTHASDSVDLSAAFTSADDTVLQLVYDGTSWYEISRSTN